MISSSKADVQTLNLECLDCEGFAKINIKLETKGANNSNVNKVLKRISKFNDEKEDKLSKPSLIKLIYMSSRNLELNSALKKLMRINTWCVTHEIRKYLWQSMLLINEENNKNYNYYEQVKTLLGSLNDNVSVDFPNFVNFGEHSNFYFLNSTGKFKVKRLLFIYAYNYPDVTFSPAIISISSLFLHYMEEHEVYQVICSLFNRKDYLVETQMSWKANCLVFNKLMKIFCVCSQLIKIIC